MFNFKKQKAFSLVEMMMLLIIASLLIAASVPIVTKRHLHLPSVANHGSYICYYKDGHLMEARKSGKINQKMLAGYPRETTNCIFEPPAKAIMFQITAIGGGGGGGDSGYKGSVPTTFENSETTLSPFNLTEQDLIAIGVTNSTAALNEAKSYMGHLWAFAQGADSGVAGPIDYADFTTETEDHDCPKNQIKYTKRTYTKYVNSSTKLCSKGNVDGYNEETVYGKVYQCYAVKNDANKTKVLKVGSYITYSGVTPQSKTCKRVTKKDIYKCVFPDPPTYSCTVPYLVSRVTHPAEYRTTGTYKTGKQNCHTVPCSNPCQYLSQVNCNKHECEVCEDEEANCGYGISQCLLKAEWTEDIWGTRTDTCEYPCENKYDSTIDVTDEWVETVPSKDIVNNQISGKYGDYNIECYEEGGSVSGSVALSYEVEEEDGCKVSTETNTISYYKRTHEKPYTEGKAPFCTSAYLTGQLGMSYNGNINFESNQAPTGEHINQNLTTNSFSLGNPHSFCDDPMVSNGKNTCGPSIGYDYKNKYAQATIKIGSTNYTITSNSAQRGAIGDMLRRASYVVDNVYTGATDDGIETTSITVYYDEVKSNSGSNGINGSCSPASTNKYDCRPNSSIRTGYCLQHDGDNESSAEYSGLYKYQDTYDINALMRGLPGEPGEFKTAVVRTLNNVDKTIHIGRGGSAAAFNLGHTGSNGSATTFGDILTANGGVGGLGSIPMNPVQLKTYDGTDYDYIKVQKCFTTSELDDDASCKAWRANPEILPFYTNTSGELSSLPTKKAVGGMFSFVLASFGISNDDTVKDLLEYAGRGGRGGGVQHFCWAGQYILTFEGHQLLKSSVYRADNLPAGVSASSIPNNHKIPIGCQSAYKTVPAGAGFDGALIITW